MIHKPVRDKHLPNGRDASLREVADCLGINRESIREIEIRALRKFKIEIEKRGYKMEDFLA